MLPHHGGSAQLAPQAEQEQPSKPSKRTSEGGQPGRAEPSGLGDAATRGTGFKLKLHGKVLGQGSFAVVHKALLQGKIVAVKVLRNEYASNHTVVRMLLKEANLLLTLDHPHIVRCQTLCQMAAGPNRLTYAMVLEYMERGSLAHLVAKQMRHPNQQLYSDEDGLRWLLQVADALSYLHSLDPMIIHRDVKPGNVLLGHAPDGGILAKLADFGLHQEVKHSVSRRPLLRVASAVARASNTGLFHTPRISDDGGLMLPPALYAACVRASVETGPGSGPLLFAGGRQHPAHAMHEGAAFGGGAAVHGHADGAAAAAGGAHARGLCSAADAAAGAAGAAGGVWTSRVGAVKRALSGGPDACGAGASPQCSREDEPGSGGLSSVARPPAAASYVTQGTGGGGVRRMTYAAPAAGPSPALLVAQRLEQQQLIQQQHEQQDRQEQDSGQTRAEERMPQRQPTQSSDSGPLFHSTQPGRTRALVRLPTSPTAGAAHDGPSRLRRASGMAHDPAPGVQRSSKEHVRSAALSSGQLRSGPCAQLSDAAGGSSSLVLGSPRGGPSTGAPGQPATPMQPRSPRAASTSNTWRALQGWITRHSAKAHPAAGPHNDAYGEYGSTAAAAGAAAGSAAVAAVDKSVRSGAPTDGRSEASTMGIAPLAALLAAQPLPGAGAATAPAAPLESAVSEDPAPAAPLQRPTLFSFIKSKHTAPRDASGAQGITSAQGEPAVQSGRSPRLEPPGPLERCSSSSHQMSHEASRLSLVSLARGGAPAARPPSGNAPTLRETLDQRQRLSLEMARPGAPQQALSSSQGFRSPQTSSPKQAQRRLHTFFQQQQQQSPPPQQQQQHAHRSRRRGHHLPSDPGHAAVTEGKRAPTPRGAQSSASNPMLSAAAPAHAAASQAQAGPVETGGLHALSTAAQSQQAMLPRTAHISSEAKPRQYSLAVGAGAAAAAPGGDGGGGGGAAAAATAAAAIPAHTAPVSSVAPRASVSGGSAMEGLPMMERVFPLSGECGSNIYMSPEVAACMPYNEKSDVFSFGVMVFEVMTRTLIAHTVAGKDGLGFTRLLLEGRRPIIPPTLNPRVVELIEALWHSDPIERPSMAQAVAVLRGVLFGMGGTSRPVTTSSLHPFESHVGASTSGRGPRVLRRADPGSGALTPAGGAHHTSGALYVSAASAFVAAGVAATGGADAPTSPAQSVPFLPTNLSSTSRNPSSGLLVPTPQPTPPLGRQLSAVAGGACVTSPVPFGPWAARAPAATLSPAAGATAPVLRSSLPAPALPPLPAPQAHPHPQAGPPPLYGQRAAQRHGAAGALPAAAAAPAPAQMHSSPHQPQAGSVALFNGLNDVRRRSLERRRSQERRRSLDRDRNDSSAHGGGGGCGVQTSAAGVAPTGAEGGAGWATGASPHTPATPSFLLGLYGSEHGGHESVAEVPEEEALAAPLAVLQEHQRVVQMDRSGRGGPDRGSTSALSVGGASPTGGLPKAHARAAPATPLASALASAQLAETRSPACCVIS